MLDSMRNPESFRFARGENTEAWLWRAEAVLLASEPNSDTQYDDIFGRAGGYWEIPQGECVNLVGTTCDQIFSIFPIHKESPLYDASFYQSAEVSYLVHDRRKLPQWGGFYRGFYGEVLDPLGTPDGQQGTLTVRWRSFAPDEVFFQKLAYRLDTPGERLMIRWGTLVDTLDAIDDPALPELSESCDGEVLTCFDHKAFGGL